MGKNLLVLTIVVLGVMGLSPLSPEHCGRSSQSLLFTGQATFVNNQINNNSRHQCFSIRVQQFTSLAQTSSIVSPKSFDYFNSYKSVDFAIKIGSVSSDNTLTVVFSGIGGNSWNSITVSYLVTKRKDILVGKFQVDTLPFLTCSKSGKIIKQSSIPFNQLALVKPQVITFISALRANSQEINISTLSVNQYQNSLKIKIQSISIIEALEISYIIYDANSISALDSYNSNSPLKQIYSSSYSFVGFHSYTQYQTVFHGFGIKNALLTCKGKNCPQKCIDLPTCYSLNGIVLQNLCILCGKQEQFINGTCRTKCSPTKIYINGQCKCPSNTYEQGGQCYSKCGTNAIFINNQCQCLKGYYYSNGQCRITPPKCDTANYQYFNGRQCACLQGYWRNDYGKCTRQCQPNYQYDVFQQKCVCNKNSVEVDGVCKQKCQQYAYYWNNRCECLPGYVRIPPWNKCGISCPPNQVLSDNKCICAKGFDRNYLGQCINQCKQNQILTFEYRCQCKPWYVRKNNICVYQPQCQQLNQQFIDGKCQCKYGYYRKYGKCVKDCGNYEQWITNNCQCIQDYVRINGSCEKQCDINEQWDSQLGCICQFGFVKYNSKKCTKVCTQGFIHHETGQCVKCPSQSYPLPQQNICVCTNESKYNINKNICQKDCPQLSTPVYTNGKIICKCVNEYYKNTFGYCEKCPINSHTNVDGTQCICNDGYFYQQQWKKCMQIPTGPSCPPKSIWNSKKLLCQCSNQSQYLINGQCQSCGHYQGWNGKSCVCQTGYYRIQGICKICHESSTYNGKQCVCNHGYYGNQYQCQQCHFSCGKCTGSLSSQCLTCSDVSYELNNGYCVRNDPCPKGLFYSKQNKSCAVCSSYCDKCENENICEKCIQGFKLEWVELYGHKAAYCVEICGDGKRFEVECDDGNLVNGDGCNQKCQVQKSWHCQGGSSVKSSNCVPFKPDRCYINPTKAVHLFGKVVQGVRLSYIPDQLTKNDCPNCFHLLLIKVISSAVVPGIRVSYLPNSKYQFYIQFQYNGLFSIPIYQFTVQLNPEFKKYFSNEDMTQVITMKIDPAVLSKVDEAQSLDLGGIELSNEALNLLDGF